jgi:Mg2+ and Co2+ transporter CorA
MIRKINLGEHSESEIKPEQLAAANLQDVWLELVDPQEDELQAVSLATQIPVNFLRFHKGDFVQLRVEAAFSVINFIVIPHVTTAAKHYFPVIMVFSKNILVTVTKKEVQLIINQAKERMSKTKIDPPSQVTYFIIDQIIDGHYGHLEKLEYQTSELEEQVIEKTSSVTLKRIFRLKAQMINFNKTLWYERGLIFNLRTCNDNCIPSKVRILFDTTHEDLTRQIDIVETYREILSDAINVHLSAISNKINLSIQGLTIVIFYLTIVTTVTSFPNTVATFFGISQFGTSPALIIALALLASIILPFLWLWRKRWLKPEKIEKITEKPNEKST